MNKDVKVHKPRMASASGQKGTPKAKSGKNKARTTKSAKHQY